MLYEVKSNDISSSHMDRSAVWGKIAQAEVSMMQR